MKTGLPLEGILNVSAGVSAAGPLAGCTVEVSLFAVDIWLLTGFSAAVFALAAETAKPNTIPEAVRRDAMAVLDLKLLLQLLLEEMPAKVCAACLTSCACGIKDGSE